MAYWWVNQNQTYRLEHSEGYLWAPLRTKNGRLNYHWDLLDQVEPGDLIFSYVHKRLCKLAIAKTSSSRAERPEGREFKPWGNQGRRIEAIYQDLPQPISNDLLQNEMGHLLKGPRKEFPLQSAGGGRQAYFFKLSPIVGRQLLKLAGLEEKFLELEIGFGLNDAGTTATGGKTTDSRVQKIRVGQEKFRDSVLQAWDNVCAVTGTKVKKAIIASHIKPWADSNDRERLDHYNGLPLVATLDSLFDNGLISFNDDGAMIIKVNKREWKALGLNEGMRLLRRPQQQMHKYLSYHRNYIFRPDVRLRAKSNFWLMEPLTKVAEDWLAAFIDPDATKSGKAYVVKEDYVDGLVIALEEEGLAVESLES